MTRIAALILAAGASRRYGAENKLLADLNGKPVLSYVLDALARPTFSQRLVVINPNGSEVASLCDPNMFDVVENHAAENGVGSSIAAGVRHLENADGVMIALGDMPFIAERTYLKIIKAFRSDPNPTIFAPSCRGRRGHPVMFRRAHFDQLQSLDGDVGAKGVIAANEAAFSPVPTSDPGVLSDIDAPSNLSRASSGLHPPSR